MASIKLDWPANPSNELVESYKLYQAVDGGNFDYLQTVFSNTVTLNNVTGDRAWKVSAVNLAGEGDQSDPVATPGLPSAPGTPTLTVV
jgi:hypothetical protein